MLPRLILRAGRERSVLKRHPWIFSGAVQELRGVANLGETVCICDATGLPLAFGAYNGDSRITARIWTFIEERRGKRGDPEQSASRETLFEQDPIDQEFFLRRIQSSIALREALLDAPDLRSCRWVHAESDGLPGLVVDRFGDQLVLQATSAGAARHKQAIVLELAKHASVASIYERSEGEVLELEGLSSASGLLWGKEPPHPLMIEERGLRFALDVQAGHKTGFYLDQRENRSLVRALAAGRDVLDAFCYSGGFSLAAVSGGAASVHALDSSEPALALARENLAANGLSENAVTFERADVFEWLRKARDSRKSFDLIVLDPPKFAPTARLAERAARAYKDINLLAFKLLRPGGLLFTFSCSAGVSPDLFQKIIAGAAADARVDAVFVRRLEAGPDHPVALGFPEGEYLKGLLCRV